MFLDHPFCFFYLFKYLSCSRRGSVTFLAGATPASKAASGSLNRLPESKLDTRASREFMGTEVQGSRADRGPPPTSSRGGVEKGTTISVVMSAESAQRLKAQAAESGLHQSDSGLASESHLQRKANIHVMLISFCPLYDGYTACKVMCRAYRSVVVHCHLKL